MMHPLLKLQVYPPDADDINPYTYTGAVSLGTFSLYYETEKVVSEDFPRHVVPQRHLVASGSAAEASVSLMTELVNLWNSK